ncbi:Deoxycytidine kinase 1 [Microbotryomycetes sp. JL221]|nr:Deoxycytidine kinase 1 [Microbotryomycetes sp. JL221]
MDPLLEEDENDQSTPSQIASATDASDAEFPEYQSRMSPDLTNDNRPSPPSPPATAPVPSSDHQGLTKTALTTLRELQESWHEALRHHNYDLCVKLLELWHSIHGQSTQLCSSTLRKRERIQLCYQLVHLLHQLHTRELGGSHIGWAKPEGQLITEDFGFVNVQHQDCKPRATFVDLDEQEVADQVFLVARVVKAQAGVSWIGVDPGSSTYLSSAHSVRSVAKEVSEDSHLGAGERSATKRSPFGCAAVDISSLYRCTDFQTVGTDSQSYSNPAATSFQLHIHEAADPAGFATLHEDIVCNRTKNLATSTSPLSIEVNLELSKQDRVEQEEPGLTIVQRLGLPDALSPKHDRNEAYIKLWSARLTHTSSAVRAFGALGNKYYEVSMQLRRSNGKQIENVLSYAAGRDTVNELRSLSVKGSTPAWGELYKVDLSALDLRQAHLLLLVRQKVRDRERVDDNERPFAFAFLPLFRQGLVFQNDGSHELDLYKYDDAVVSSASYLSLVSADEPGSEIPQVTKDTITIRICLVSTKLTQDDAVSKLLHWETLLANDSEKTRKALRAIMFSDKIEICKFLRPIFDALFGLQSTAANHDGTLDDFLFEAIAMLLNTVADRRFKEFEATLDFYLDNQFSDPNAGSLVLRGMGRLLADSDETEKGTLLRASIKSWQYLFKIALLSQRLRRNGKSSGIKVPSEQLEESFRLDFGKLLESVFDLMRKTSPPQIIGTQALALQNFVGLVPLLREVYSEVEVAERIVVFMDQARPTRELSAARLIAIGQIVTDSVFYDADARALLVPCIVRWLKPALGRFDDHVFCRPKDSQAIKDVAKNKWLESLRLAVAVVASMVDKIQMALSEPSISSSRSLYGQECDNIEYALGMLPRLMETFKEFEHGTSLDAARRQASGARTSSGSMIPLLLPLSLPVPLLSRSVTGGAKDSSSQGDHAEDLTAASADTACAILGLLQTAPVKVLINWMDALLEVEGRDNFARILAQIFQTLKTFISNAIIPERCVNLRVLTHHTTLKLATSVADFLERDFIPSSTHSQSAAFKTGLWRDFFEMVLALANSPLLAAEHLRAQERHVVEALLGDCRNEVGSLFKRMWNAIGWPEQSAAGAQSRSGGYQVQFVPGLLGGVLKMCMSTHSDSRRKAVNILFSMIVSEWHLSTNFLSIEVEVINRLDQFFLLSDLREQQARSVFVADLRHLFDHAKVDSNLQEQVDRFLESVENFLELLSAIKVLPPSNEWQRDRVDATLNLMQYLKKIGRVEAYIKYIEKLANHYEEAEQYAQAGLILHQYASTLEWDLDKILPEVIEAALPCQNAFLRKRTIYFRAIDLLSRGMAWEVALTLCKELHLQLESVTFDYEGLKRTMGLQTSLYSEIAQGERPDVFHYRVAFYGSEFPASVAGKQFIYQSSKERDLDAFTAAMLEKHSAASLIRGSAIPSEEIQFGHAQYLQINAVLPESESVHPVLTNPMAPAALKKYYRTHETNRFILVRSFVREDGRDIGASGDISSTWTEKTVVEIQISEISPIEIAINDLIAQRETLELTERKFRIHGGMAKNRTELDLTELAVALNEVIDCSSESRGHSTYRRTYLDAYYPAKHPEQHKALARLRRCLEQLTLSIARCLNLLSSLGSGEVLEFYKQLKRLFEREFSIELQYLPVAEHIERHAPQFTHLDPTTLELSALPAESTNGAEPTQYETLSTIASQDFSASPSMQQANQIDATENGMRSPRAASIVSEAPAASTYSRRPSVLGSLRSEGGRRSSVLLDFLKRKPSTPASPEV